MTVDTYNMLIENQKLLDAANKTITETQKTEQTLQEHILLTDAKIGTHNEHFKAHPDIRLALDGLPSFILDPEIVGPDAVESGDTATWTISAVSLMPTVQVTTIFVTDDTGTIHELDAPLGSATFTHTFTGEKNEKKIFTVQARGTYNYMSKVVSKEILITVQVPPAFTTMSENIPEVINPGNSYDIIINGIVDLDNDLDVVRLTANNANVLFPEGNVVTQGTALPITASAALVTASTVVFTITAVDKGNRSNTFTKNVHVNTPPDITNIVCTVDTLLNANSFSDGAIYGVTDDFSEVSCVVSCTHPDITITPTEIGIGDTVRVAAGDIAPNTSVPVTFTFSDNDGGSAVYLHNVKINNPPVVTDMVCTLPAYIAPNKVYTFSVSGATDPDGGDILYGIDISNLPLGMTLSKTTNIAENEEITLTTAEDMPRLMDAQQLRVLAYDNRNKSVQKSFEYHINQALLASAVTVNIPSLVKPGLVVNLEVTSPVTHVSGTAYSYSFVSADETKLIVDSDPVTATVVKEMTVGDETAFTRGTTSVLTLHVNDGVEIHELPYTLLQNTLPLATDIMCSLGIATTMYGGSENAATFTLSGGSDIESGITYEVNMTDLTTAGATLSKTSLIAANEEVTLTVAKVAESSTLNLEVWAVDSMDEKSELTQVTIVTVEPIMVSGAPSIIYPATDDQAPYYDGFTMTWSEATIVPWLGDGTYPNNI